MRNYLRDLESKSVTPNRSQMNKQANN